MIDILMPGGVKNIVELTQVVKHSVSVEELNGLFSGQVHGAQWITENLGLLLLAANMVESKDMSSCLLTYLQ